MTYEQKVAAVTLSTNAIASHRTAAQLWGLLPRALYEFEFTMQAGLSSRVTGARVHRSESTDVAAHRGIRVTTVERTLIDLARVAPHLVETALDVALRLRITDLAKLRKTIDAYACSGRAYKRIWELVDDRIHDSTQSELERSTLGWLKQSKIRGVKTQHPLVVDGIPLHIDIALPEARIAIECQGYNYHSSRAAFDDDAVRFSRFASVGWLLMVVTSKTDRASFLDQVRSAQKFQKEKRFVQKRVA